MEHGLPLETDLRDRGIMVSVLMIFPLESAKAISKGTYVCFIQKLKSNEKTD